MCLGEGAWEQRWEKQGVKEQCKEQFLSPGTKSEIFTRVSVGHRAQVEGSSLWVQTLRPG